MRGEEFYEVGGLTEGAGEVEEVVALVEVIDLLCGKTYGLSYDSDCAGFAVVVADSEWDSLAEFIGAYYYELAREG